MIMSFASPLGLGLESDGEYMDISVKQSPSSKEAVETTECGDGRRYRSVKLERTS